MDLEQELRAIWAKYEPQRAIERAQRDVEGRAARELAELNERRRAVGLGAVEEWPDYASAQALGQIQGCTPRPRTWHDDLDTELLAAVKARIA